MPSFPSGRTSKITIGLGVLSLLTACASNGGSPSGDGGSQGVTGTSIKVAGLLTKTSSIGYSTAEAELGAKARFERANAGGGVNGRKVEFLGAENDSMDPATGLAATRRLVEKDGVFAIVPVSAPSFSGMEYLEQRKTPWFGWITNPAQCGLSTAFGYNGCLTPKPGVKLAPWWGEQITAELGGKDKSVWLQGTDTTSSKAGTEAIRQTFSDTGFKITGVANTVPAGAPPQDWLPYVNKVKAASGGGWPDIVASIMSGVKHNNGFYAALKKAGFKGMITDATSYDPKVLADPQSVAALEGVYVGLQVAAFESQSPEVELMKQDLRRTGGQDIVFSQQMAIGYWSADVFLKVLEKTGEDVTRENFLKASDGFSYENAGFGRIAYPRNKTLSSGCGTLVQIVGGGFRVAQELKCVDPVE